MKRIILVLVILTAIGGTAFSFDILSFPSPIEKGDILVSPTVSFGRYWSWSTAVAITAAVDYALPIPIALTVGGEAGIALVLGDYSDLITLPIFARVAWHPNFEVPNLDPYVTLKLGYNINLAGEEYHYGSYEVTYGGGFSYGGNVGVRYFFTPAISAFGELGYDRYGVSYKERAGTWNYTYSYYIYTWFHAGVTFKF
ncbi:MAG: hypothetical protein LBU82_07615 [Treponema sp.]|jgi:hypothetical protein|nr:hypothetical protein [Treponema sp.]